MMKHSGSCHCGAIKFTVEIDASRGSRCNCSICTKLGGIGAIAKPDRFHVAGEAECLTYQWGGRTATRYFCKRCGITCYLRGHLEQLGGDYISVMLNTLDDIDPSTVEVTYWDGRHDNWQAGPRSTPYPIYGGGNQPADASVDAARAQTSAASGV